MAAKIYTIKFGDGAPIKPAEGNSAPRDDTVVRAEQAIKLSSQIIGLLDGYDYQVAIIAIGSALGSCMAAFDKADSDMMLGEAIRTAIIHHHYAKGTEHGDE